MARIYTTLKLYQQYHYESSYFMSNKMLKSLAYSISTLLLQMTLMNFIPIEKSVNTHQMNFKLA